MKNIIEEKSTQQAILKYLEELLGKFNTLKKGIEANEALWKNFSISPGTIESHVNEVYGMGTEIEKLKEELSMKLAEARIMREDKRKIIEKIEKRAIGLHIDDQCKLEDYGIDI